MRRHLRAKWEPEPDGAVGRLGAWYANFFSARPRHLAIAVSERSLLVVLLPVAPVATFRERLRTAVVRRLWEVPAPPAAILREEQTLTEFALCRTQSRSVLGSMNELAFLGRGHLEADPDCDLDALGRFLCDTPMFALSTTWPFREAVVLLTGKEPTGENAAPDAT